MWGEERRRIKRIEAGMTEPGGDELPLAGSTAPALASSPLPSRSSASSNQDTSPLSDLTHVDPRHPSTFSDPGRETFSERSDRLASSGWSWFTDKLSVLAPLKRIDEDEYERRLDELLKLRTGERDQVKTEIRDLEVVKKRLEERQREADALAK